MPLSFIPPVENVFIASAYSNKNFFDRPEGETLFVGSFAGTSDVYRSLLKFDLFDKMHGIPCGITIKQAILVLQLVRNDHAGTAQVDGFRLLDDFSQDTTTFMAAPESSFPSSDGAWGAQMPLAGQNIIFFDITELVQGWYDGSTPNHGIELRGLEDAGNNILAFRSSHFPDSTSAPNLMIFWTKESDSVSYIDMYSASPSVTTSIPMAGREEVTFLIANASSGNLQGFVQYSLDQGATFSDDPTSAFSVPPAGASLVSSTGQTDLVRIHITAAGTGIYTVTATTNK